MAGHKGTTINRNALLGAEMIIRRRALEISLLCGIQNTLERDELSGPPFGSDHDGAVAIVVTRDRGSLQKVFTDDKIVILVGFERLEDSRIEQQVNRYAADGKQNPQNPPTVTYFGQVPYSSHPNIKPLSASVSLVAFSPCRRSQTLHGIV